MESEMMDKVLNAIYPATDVNNINLDYTGNVCFGDLFIYNGKIIGAGGFGVVISAVEKKTSEETAIKILNINQYFMLSEEYRRSPIKHQDSIALKTERSTNFIKNELEIMKKMKHKNIMELVGTYRSQDHVLIVMKKAEGSLLNFIQKNGGKLPETVCKEIIRQVLRGLKFLHKNSYVHRDIKPGNVLLMSFTDIKDAVKITDFSISTNLENATLSELVDTVGTFYYKAPEQMRAQPCTRVTDMWAVGIMLCEMLTGKHPIHVPGVGGTEYLEKITTGKFQRPSDFPDMA